MLEIGVQRRTIIWNNPNRFRGVCRGSFSGYCSASLCLDRASLLTLDGQGEDHPKP